jgi:phospholipid transport system substrate-binding protein
MSQFFKYITILLMLGICAGLGAQAADSIAPDEIIRRVADDVVSALKADKDIQAGDRKKAYALIDAKVIPHFDFVRMTRLAMGRNWRDATPEQQKQLTDGFRDLLVRTYSTSLTQFKNQTIQVKNVDSRPDESDVLVHTLIIPSGGQNIPVDYNLERVPDGWLVFDIKVDGVSLVTNYRNEFSDVVHRSGIDGLIKVLEDKRRLAAKQ